METFERVFLCSSKCANGFTIVELLVTIAVIGILTQLSITSYQRNAGRSRQSEAKIALTSIYTLEKSFYSEYSAYIPSFTAIGYTPEGNSRYYRVGQAAVAGLPLYPGAITGYSGSVATQYYLDKNLPATWTPCQLNELTNLPQADQAPYDVDNPQGFLVGAAGRIINNGSTSATCDWWLINQMRSLQNTQVGL